MVVARRRGSPAAADDIIARAPVGALGALLALELGPALHGDLGAIELALVLEAGLLGLLAGRLARIAPGEVVKLPEGVRGKYKVPDGQGEEVDGHPDNVGRRVGRHNNQDTRKT